MRDETYTAFENIYPVLTEFRKNQQWYEFVLIYLTFSIHTDVTLFSHQNYECIRFRSRKVAFFVSVYVVTLDAFVK